MLLVFTAVLAAPAPADHVETATVRYVIDGDSVVLGDKRQVRLIGINAPELGKEGRPDEPFARAARERLQALVLNRPVQLTLEAEPRDHYGRWLAHLKLPEGQDIATVLLKEGLASAIAIPPNTGQWSDLFAAESVARQARRGLWGHAYSRPLPVESLDAAHSGFHFVRGRISHVGRSQKYIYLDIGSRFALRIRHSDWQQYFHGSPADWRGAQIEARGWVVNQNERLVLGIGHPAMLQRLP